MTTLPNNECSALSALDARRSTPASQLGAPGPDDATLLRMLRAASRVPDHGKRVPFRFIRIAGQARDRLGALAEAQLLVREPDAGEGAREKARRRFSHAPLVITVVAVFDQDDTAIPAQERLLTAGCVCFALLQAAQALGFGAVWLTGWAADDAAITGALGVGAQERIVGFIHIGTPTREAPERERPDPAALLTDWQGD